MAGSLVGMPQLGVMFGGVFGSLIDSFTTSDKSTNNFSQEGLADVSVTSAALGKMIPKVRGRFRIPGNIIDATDKVKHENTTSSGSTGGGKGGFGGAEQVSSTITYTVTLDIGLCEGPIIKVAKVWADASLIYDDSQEGNHLSIQTSDATSKTMIADDNVQTAILYYGGEDQEPPVDFETVHGVGNVPAYRGLAHIVMKDLDLGTAGRIPNFTFEVVQANRIEGTPIAMVAAPDCLGVLMSNNLFGETDHRGIISTFAYLTLEVAGSNEKDLGYVPVGLAYMLSGGMVGNPSMFAALMGSTDGIHQLSDSIMLFSGPSVDYAGTIPIRTASEETAHTILGAHTIQSDRDENCWVLCTNLNSLIQFSILGNGVPTRLAMGSVTRKVVWSPTGGAGHVFVIRDTNTCTKVVPGTPTTGMSIVESFTVGAGRSTLPGDIIGATDGKVWLCNVNDDTVAHFTGSGDYATVAVGDGPTCLTEASDGRIWVAHQSVATVRRIHQTAYTTETFTVPAILTQLAAGSSGSIWGISSSADTAYRITSAGVVTQVRTPRNPTRIVSDTLGNAYIACEAGRTVFYIKNDATDAFTQATPSGTLACVVRGFTQDAGVPTEMIDVAGLDNSPVNLLVSNVQSVKNILDGLAYAYNFIGVESDGVLRYLFKNGPTVATIPENALSAGEDDQTQQGLAVTRMQERELPSAVSVVHADPERNYESNTQIVKMNSSKYFTETPFNVDVPVALFGSQAAILAEMILYELWSGRESFQFTYGTQLLSLEPTDIISITGRGITYTCRVMEINRGANWLSEVKAIGHNSSVFTDFRLNPSVVENGNTILLIIARASDLLIDVPPLVSTDVLPRYFAAPYTTESTRTFVSASLYESLDGGTSYNFKAISSKVATIGTVASALPSASYYVWDDTNTITVVLYTGTLTSVSELDVLNGENWAMLGSELIAFQNATLTGPNTCNLTHLLRGRKGSESFIGTHGVNEKFYLLDAVTKNNHRIDYTRSQINATRKYKVIDPVTIITDAVAFDFAPNGTSVRPWAPVIGTLLRNTPSTDDVTFQFLYRSRLNPDLVNNTGISWDVDASKVFNVIIYADGTYAVVKRTIVVGPVTTTAEATQTTTYTSAQQTTDFGAPQSTIYYGILEVGTGILGYESRTSG